MNKRWWKDEIKRREELLGRKRPDKCEICNRKGKIEFDHDHKTGKARGWICMQCNTILGKVGDNPQILKTLIKYLNVE